MQYTAFDKYYEFIEPANEACNIPVYDLLLEQRNHDPLATQRCCGFVELHQQSL
jgi:hypothetical protein